MEKYISTNKSTAEAISRRRIFGVSLSLSASSCAAADVFFSASAPLGAAPYPAFSTAEIIACSDAVPSTRMEFVKRLTAQLLTPATPLTAFSTRALHAAQLIPLTANCVTLFFSCSSILSPFPKTLLLCACILAQFSLDCKFFNKQNAKK